jgi:cell division protein FtsW
MSPAAMQASRSTGTGMRIQVQQHLDIGLVLTVAALLILGLVMVASASITIADRQYGNPMFFFQRQVVFVMMGLVIAFAMYRIRLVHWERSGQWLLLFGLFLLVLILLPGVGHTVKGSTRWLPLGFISLQVSEFAKLFVAIYMAGYLVRKHEEVVGSFQGFIKPIGVLALCSLLLMLEPDFGATVVLLTMGMGMLFLGGARLGQFASLLGIVVAAMAVLAISSPYRLRRLTSFMDPWQDPFNSGFQLTQSLIAIGSGSWTGTGLGASVQKLFYLPEAHNDFLFAVFAEEFGFIGVSVVVMLFTYLIWRCFAIGAAAERAGHAFGAYLAYGFGIWIGMQAFINMGVNMGILPTKGLTLPLMSAGGSSMLVMCAVIGLLLRIHREVHDGGVAPSSSAQMIARKRR